MEIPGIVAAGIVIGLAGVLQSAVGFGYALFAAPLLVLLGIPLQSVIVLVASCSTLQSIIGARKLRDSVPWRASLAASGTRVLSVVVGVVLLKKLITLDQNHIRLVIGLILCCLVGIQMLWRPAPTENVRWGWGWFAFIASGLLAGVCGMGGPPLVLWSMAHDWPARKTRGFLFAVFAVSIPAQIAIFALTFGPGILWAALAGIGFLPVVYLGAAIGLPIGNRMGRERLRAVAYAILLVVGVSAVVPALLSR